MDMKLIFPGQFDIHKKVGNICTLVSLKLNHLTILWVVNYCPITVKFLQEKLKNKRVQNSDQ